MYFLPVANAVQSKAYKKCYENQVNMIYYEHSYNYGEKVRTFNKVNQGFLASFIGKYIFPYLLTPQTNTELYQIIVNGPQIDKNQYQNVLNKSKRASFICIDDYTSEKQFTNTAVFKDPVWVNPNDYSTYDEIEFQDPKKINTGIDTIAVKYTLSDKEKETEYIKANKIDLLILTDKVHIKEIECKDLLIAEARACSKLTIDLLHASRSIEVIAGIMCAGTIKILDFSSSTRRVFGSNAKYNLYIEKVVNPNNVLYRLPGGLTNIPDNFFVDKTVVLGLRDNRSLIGLKSNKELERIISSKGGKLEQVVDKNTDFYVYDDISTLINENLLKAKRYGIPILSSRDLEILLGGV